MSLFSKDAKATQSNGGNGDTPPHATKLPNSGPLMLLKSLGIDPQEIMTGVQQAAATAQQVTQNFDRRLTAIETKLVEISRILHEFSEQNKVLCQVVSGLKVTSEPDLTEPNIESVAAGRIVED